MNYIVPLIVTAFLFSACQSTSPVRKSGDSNNVSSVNKKVRIEGGDGATCENAVAIYSETYDDGFKAEYDWLKEHYPGYEKKGVKTLSGDEGKRFDVFEIITANGGTRSICIDVTDFISKWDQ